MHKKLPKKITSSGFRYTKLIKEIRVYICADETIIPYDCFEFTEAATTYNFNPNGAYSVSYFIECYSK